MKTTSIFMLAFFMAAFIMTGSYAATKENGDAPYLTKEFTMSEPGLLQAELLGGDIEVIANESNKIKVEMYVRKRNKNIGPGDAAVQDDLDFFQIDISQAAESKVSVVVKQRSPGGEKSFVNINLFFRVYVPKNISCDFKTTGGSVNLNGVTGTHNIHTIGGSLTLQKVAGNTEAKVIGGKMDINNYAGLLNAHVSGGSIKLQDSQGELKAQAKGGHITLDNVEGSVEVSTSGGNIDAHLYVLDKGLKLKANGGNINAVIPSGLGLDLDLSGNKVKTNSQNFTGDIGKHLIRGSMNGGGIPVVMTSLGGKVHLKYH